MEIDESGSTSVNLRTVKQIIANHPIMMAQRSLETKTNQKLKLRAGVKARTAQVQQGQRGSILRFLVRQESESSGSQNPAT